MLHDKREHGRPLLFGEVLLDQLPGGRALLGGAPFNVAWHLHGFGLQPLLVSRVGEDVPGDWVLRRMRDWGMDTSGMQIDSHHPTGSVQVRLKDGQPSFHILADQAYDHIEAGAAEQATRDGAWALLYHGTLAARSIASRATLAMLRGVSAAPRFVDANLRTPWWEAERVGDLLGGSRWLKLSRTELLELTGTVMNDMPTVTCAAQDFRRRHNLDLLIVTDGEKGAHYFTAQSSGFQPAHRVDDVSDTIGAGDAFSAVSILGLLKEWPLPQTMARAAEFAARICTLPGATGNDGALYHEMLERWRV